VDYLNEEFNTLYEIMRLSGCKFIHRENKKEIKNLSNTLPLYLAPKKMINLYNTHIENLSIHRVGNKSRNEAIFLSEQPFTLNDEMCLWWRNFSLNPREKRRKLFSVCSWSWFGLQWYFKFATEILTILVVLMKFLKNHNTPLEQSNHPHIKNGEVYVT
jgi:hypothetical protein